VSAAYARGAAQPQADYRRSFDLVNAGVVAARRANDAARCRVAPSRASHLSSPADSPNPFLRVGRALRAALSGAEHDCTRGSLQRALLLLAVPMVLEMAMESVFAVVDVFFVARLGPEAVATVGLTESVLTLVYALAIGLSAATTATVARRVGEGDRPAAAHAAGQALLLGLLLALCMGVPGALFAGDILALMHASPETIEAGSGYTALQLGGNAVILLLFLQNAVFRGAGDAVIAMRSLALANLINIVLDPCLIFGLGPFPALGLDGAALATLTGRAAGVVYQYRALRRGQGRLQLPPRLRFDPTVAWKLLRLSAGGVGQYLVATSSWLVLMRIMSGFGAQAVAGYTIAIRIMVFVLLPSFGLANAATTLVGQNLGAGQPDRAARAVWLTALYNVGFVLVVMQGFLWWPEVLVGWFLPATDGATAAGAVGAPAATTAAADVLAVGSQALRVLSYGFPCYALGMVLTNAFNGAGDTLTPTRVNLVSFWLLQLPCAWFLSRALGPSGVVWAVVAGETVLTVLAFVLFRRGRWRTRAV